MSRAADILVISAADATGLAKLRAAASQLTGCSLCCIASVLSQLLQQCSAILEKRYSTGRSSDGKYAGAVTRRGVVIPSTMTDSLRAPGSVFLLLEAGW